MTGKGPERAMTLEAIAASERAVEACREASSALRRLLQATLPHARRDDANLVDALGGGATLATLTESTLEVTVDTLRLHRDGLRRFEVVQGGAEALRDAADALPRRRT